MAGLTAAGRTGPGLFRLVAAAAPSAQRWHLVPASAGPVPPPPAPQAQGVSWRDDLQHQGAAPSGPAAVAASARCWRPALAVATTDRGYLRPCRPTPCGSATG